VKTGEKREDFFRSAISQCDEVHMCSSLITFRFIEDLESGSLVDGPSPGAGPVWICWQAALCEGDFPLTTKSLDLMVQNQSTSIMVHLEIHSLDRLVDVSRLRDLNFVSSLSPVPAGPQHCRDGVEDVLNSPEKLGYGVR
jgi:hypothetical protein